MKNNNLLCICKYFINIDLQSKIIINLFHKTTLHYKVNLILLNLLFF